MFSIRNLGILDVHLVDDCDWEDSCIPQALQDQVRTVCQVPQGPDPVKHDGRKEAWIHMIGTHRKFAWVL